MLDLMAGGYRRYNYKVEVLSESTSKARGDYCYIYKVTIISMNQSILKNNHSRHHLSSLLSLVLILFFVLTIVNGLALSRSVISFKGNVMLYFWPQVCARNAWLSTVILRKIVSGCERSVRWEERVASVLIRGIAGSGVVAEFWPKVMSWQRWGGVARNARCTLLLLVLLLLSQPLLL